MIKKCQNRDVEGIFNLYSSYIIAESKKEAKQYLEQGKITAEDYEYIKDARRVDLDGKRFVLNSSFRGHGLFDSQYYTLYLKPDP